MGYAWRCKECGQDFEPTGRGYTLIKQHGLDEHGMKPGECVEGVVDTETGEVMQTGWGPMVLRAARKRGWVAESQDTQGAPGGTPGAGDANIIPLETGKRTKAPGKSATRPGAPSATILAANVRLSAAVQLVFYEAQARYPQRYPDHSPESVARFITDAVVAYAVWDEFNMGNVIAEELRSLYVAGDEA